MSWMEFSSSIVENIAWPLVVVIALFMLRNKISDLLLRLLAVKYKDFSLQFSEVSKKIVEGNLSSEEKSKWKSQQIEHETDYYRLYKNGMLVQNLNVSFRSTSPQRVVYPITFPNEVMSISAIGDLDIRVIDMGQSNCTISVPEINKEEVIKLVISGI